MTTVPTYLGSKISLISKSEIRYEGILYTIDTKESTLALAKVRSFGTEGRPTDRPLAPRDEVYEYIIFRVNDIKDLHICEPPKSHHGLPHDPAIVQHSPPVSNYSALQFGQSYGAVCGLHPFQHFPSQTGYTHIPSILTAGHYSGASSRSGTPTSQRKSPTTDAGVQVSVEGSDSIQDPRIEARNQMRHRTRDQSQFNYQQQRRAVPVNRRQDNRRGNSYFSRRGRGRGAGTTSEVLKFDSEYDFEQANAEFQELESKLAKNNIEEAVQESVQASEESGFYDRNKSFFDDISCEATQRSKGFDWRNERKLNVETFGASANSSWLRRRRGRGGFRRGGYRSRGDTFSTTRSTETQAVTQVKTVTFDETPVIKEVEIEETEDNKPADFPVIELVVEKEKGWPEGTEKTENVWE